MIVARQDCQFRDGPVNGASLWISHRATQRARSEWRPAGSVEPAFLHQHEFEHPFSSAAVRTAGRSCFTRRRRVHAVDLRSVQCLGQPGCPGSESCGGARSGALQFAANQYHRRSRNQRRCRGRRPGGRWHSLAHGHVWNLSRHAECRQSFLPDPPWTLARAIRILPTRPRILGDWISPI